MPATFTLTGELVPLVGSAKDRDGYVQLSTEVVDTGDNKTYEVASRIKITGGSFAWELPAWDPAVLPYSVDEPLFGIKVTIGSRVWEFAPEMMGETLDLSDVTDPWAAPYVPVVVPGPPGPPGTDGVIAPDGSFASYKNLTRNPDAIITGAVTRDSNGAATSAAVTWPDGTTGTYTALVLSSAFPGAVDSYEITYGSPVTKTYTQPAITRDANGAATNVPAIVVS